MCLVHMSGGCAVGSYRHLTKTHEVGGGIGLNRVFASDPRRNASGHVRVPVSISPSVFGAIRPRPLLLCHIQKGS